MRSLAALAAAGLLAAPVALAATAVPGGTGDVSLDGDSVSYDVAANVYRAEGHVVIRRGAVVLRANAVTYDATTGEVSAAGGVLLTDATRALSADGVRTVLGGPFTAEHVVAFLKDGPVALGDATTIDEARRIGPNRASLRGRRLEGQPDGRLRLGGATVTLCDCGGAAPSWEIRAREADVIPGQRAVLSWPVLYVTPRFLFVDEPVPVLAVPWAYVPLSDRQTGLLIPMFGSTGATGFSVAEPIFVTLGRSADLTFTPEYMFGPAATGDDPSVRGPGARLELRWAPAVGTEGRVEVDWVHDLDREPRGGWGDRVSINGRHEQRLGSSTRLGVDVALASDPVWYRDFTSDLLLRGAFYSPSAALLARAGDAVTLEASAAYYEPLAPGGRVPGIAYGSFGGELPVFQRWPTLAAELLPERTGPVLWSGRAGLSRYAPLSGFTSDGGLDGLGPGDRGWGGPSDPPLGEGDGRWDPRERLAATRADARLEVEAPIPLLGGGLRLAPYLRGAATGYLYDAALDPEAAAWGVFGAAASAEFVRRSGSFRSSIVPRVEYRGGTGVAGRTPPIPAFDPWDRVADEQTIEAQTSAGVLTLPPRRFLTAAPDGVFHQLRLSVDGRFELPGFALRLEVGQDLDLRLGRFAETFATGNAVAGPLSVGASARLLAIQPRPEEAPPPTYGSWLDDFTDLRASVALADRRGDRVHASLLAVGPGASGALMAGVDPLFDLRPASFDAVAQGTAGARAVIGPATLGYDVLVPGRAIAAPTCDGTGMRRLDAFHVQQHAAALSWDSPCHCFAARVTMRLDDCGRTSFSASFDLSRLGEHTAFR